MMIRTMSPLDPRVDGHVGDRELDQILGEMVEPSRGDTVLSWELRSAIVEELGVGVDGFRMRLAMIRVLEPCTVYSAMQSGMAFGRLCRGLSAHQRIRINFARLEDEAAWGPRP